MGCSLKATVVRTVPPTTAEGIEKYLGRGMVKGIGPVFAKRMVGRFGPDIRAHHRVRSAHADPCAGNRRSAARPCRARRCQPCAAGRNSSLEDATFSNPRARLP